MAMPWMALLGAALLSAAPAAAAQAPKLLASYPTLTTAAALKAAQAALARCDKEGFTATVAVVDRGATRSPCCATASRARTR